MRWRKTSLLLIPFFYGACATMDPYAPAIPAPRAHWDNSQPWLLENPPPPELRYVSLQPQQPWPSEMPREQDWQQWESAQSSKGRKTRRGRTTVARVSFDDPEAPTTTHRMASGTIVSYAYQPNRHYTIRTEPSIPTHILIPEGQKLAALPAINEDIFVVDKLAYGDGATRQQVIVIRPKEIGLNSSTIFFLQSGVKLYCDLLVSSNGGGMLSVTWDIPTGPQAPPEPPIHERPPKVDMGRLFQGYTLTVESKTTPPWKPVTVFDDGTHTYIRFAEALTYTRAPGVFGLTPAGKTALVQSRMWVKPGAPESGAILTVQGLWPALELIDGAKLKVKIVRQAVPATTPGDAKAAKETQAHALPLY